VPNVLRVGEAHHRANFGLVEIDWARRELRLGLRDADGAVLIDQRVPLSSLRVR
jgi:alkaline phosphatase D